MARILVTGATGFVGGWLLKELESGGHEWSPLDPGIDVRDAMAVRAIVDRVEPDAIIHLAAVSFAPDAAADLFRALSVAVGGTANLMEIARSMEPAPVVLVVGSSEAYGPPLPHELPLSETQPLRPQSAYGLSKLAQESVAMSYAMRYGLRVAVSRSFNHSGPGQRSEFVLPALTRRIKAIADGSADAIQIGNLDVRRDFSDVRDVVLAYRLIVESLMNGQIAPGGIVVNVCSGVSTSIRSLAEQLCEIAGVAPRFVVDQSLVREDDPPNIFGDPALLNRLIGPRTRTPLRNTLAAMWRDVNDLPVDRDSTPPR